MLTPAAVSWAARVGLIHLEGTPLAFFGFAYAPLILTLLAVGELIGDKLPMTPSRKMLVPFFGRIVIGGVLGCALGLTAHQWTTGWPTGLYPYIISGALGGVVGTLAGYSARAQLAVAFGKDFPAAVIEDVVAIALSAFVVTRF